MISEDASTVHQGLGPLQPNFIRVLQKCPLKCDRQSKTDTLIGNVSMLTLPGSIRRACVDFYFTCFNYHENIDELQQNIN